MTGSTDKKKTGWAGLRLLRRFRRNDRGVVAIEFAMLALPFFALVFAIIETCLSFAAGQLLQNSVDRVARELRTGQILPVQATSTRIYSEVCSGMAIMLVDDTCPDLVIDLKTFAEYSDFPTGITRLGNGDVDTSGFTIDPAGPRGKAQMRAFYRWAVYTDLMKSRIANVNRGASDGKILLFGTMTWQNEPFS